MLHFLKGGSSLQHKDQAWRDRWFPDGREKSITGHTCTFIFYILLDFRQYMRFTPGCLSVVNTLVRSRPVPEERAHV